ncbi:hypothetical protein AKJ38_02445 [candidate division MSBL1 archaeon SCGC-AAA259I14]|uniref:Uncharacterized protein n=2 Tax=candidate division MSBL1 TaxID=215777 RepID=A0A133URQ8_9EURY|nr:hypothetical protein AKJ66_01635 [candidate division MSBL1 archaeon SCGC-AAA259E22]KXA96873.1 hypothetical protein AKJ38_02445 [candidate division MSBL1 archaeon SCGC-AAA259I14]
MGWLTHSPDAGNVTQRHLCPLKNVLGTVEVGINLVSTSRALEQPLIDPFTGGSTPATFLTCVVFVHLQDLDSFLVGLISEIFHELDWCEEFFE